MYRVSKKRKGKIMVLGYLGAKIDDYITIAALYNIPREDLTFINDPNNFRIKKIFNSEYTDLIFAAWPHHVEGSPCKNLPRTIKENPEHYPKLWTKAETGVTLKKLSISDFEEFIKQSVYFKINNLKIINIDRGLELNSDIKNKEKVSKPQQVQTVSKRKSKSGTTVSNYFKEFEKKYGC